MGANFFDDWFGSFIAPKEQLDNAWREACISGDFFRYSNMVDNIKKSGKRIYRNSKGEHKVV